MGELAGDAVAALFGRQAYHQLGHASVDVEQHERADLVVRATEAARELAEEGDRDPGGGAEPSAEVLAPEGEHDAVLHRDDVRRSGLVIQERHLAEKGPFAQHGEDHLTAILADEDHLHVPVDHEVECITGVILEQDDTPLGVAPLPHQFTERHQLRLGEGGEQGDLLEDGQREDWQTDLVDTVEVAGITLLSPRRGGKEVALWRWGARAVEQALRIASGSTAPAPERHSATLP